MRDFAPAWPRSFAEELGIRSGGGILPLLIDFSTQPDGALPSPLVGATWTIASGAAKNTPTEGANLLTDGGMENWLSATNLTSWTETLAGTGTVNREGTNQRSGTFAARIDIGADNADTQILQSLTGVVAVGDFVTLRVYPRSSTAGKSYSTRFNNQHHQTVNAAAANGSYALAVHSTLISSLISPNLILGRSSAASSSLYYDDATLNKLTKTTLYAVANSGVADVIVKANWTTVTGSLAGVIANLDDPANPQNYVMLLHDGPGNNLILLKVVAGVSTQIAIPAATYVAGAAVELRKTGTTYKMFYNGAQVSTDQTISDTGIISNTRHGLFSSYDGNTCSFFSLAAA